MNGIWNISNQIHLSIYMLLLLLTSKPDYTAYGNSVAYIGISFYLDSMIGTRPTVIYARKG